MVGPHYINMITQQDEVICALVRVVAILIRKNVLAAREISTEDYQTLDKYLIEMNKRKSAESSEK